MKLLSTRKIGANQLWSRLAQHWKNLFFWVAQHFQRSEKRALFPDGLSRPGLRKKLAVLHNLITATLREIFDESAYERFLLRHDLRPSVAAYAAFWSEHESTKVRRPRCC